MTNQTTPVSFSFKSFGNDEVTSTEELFIIDNNTIIFNRDLVDTTAVDYVSDTTTIIYLHLLDGRTEKKAFSTANNKITEV